MGCRHDDVASMQREAPMRLEIIPSMGTATWAGVTRAPLGGRLTSLCFLGLRHGRETWGTSPRLSSKIDQSGEYQSSSGCLASGGTLPPLADPLGGRDIGGRLGNDLVDF